MICRVYNKDLRENDVKSKADDALLGKVPNSQGYSRDEFECFLSLCDILDSPLILIAHMTDNQINKAIGILKDTRTILVRCSSSRTGRSGNSHFVEGNLFVLELGVSFLNENLSWSEIVGFFEGNFGDAQAIITGYVPYQLRKYFGHGRTELPVLSDLSILCQGFLAVHSNPRGEPEGVLEKDHKDVRDALVKMGWPELCQGNACREFLISALLDCSKNGRRERNSLRSCVADQVYWEPLVTTISNLVKQCGNAIQMIHDVEWVGLPGYADWGPVQLILERIGDSKLSDLNPGIIARAFVQLANRLGEV